MTFPSNAYKKPLHLPHPSSRKKRSLSDSKVGDIWVGSEMLGFGMAVELRMSRVCDGVDRVNRRSILNDTGSAGVWLRLKDQARTILSKEWMRTQTRVFPS